jgi:hypothetical protein
VVSFVGDNFVAPGLRFTDSDFRELAIDAFLGKCEDAGLDMPMFQCSAGFIVMFKARHQLTPRKIHFKCRSAVTDK